MNNILGIHYLCDMVLIYTISCYFSNGNEINKLHMQLAMIHTTIDNVADWCKLIIFHTLSGVLDVCP